MTVSRALLFATFMAPFAAYGQFGDMPGMPGGVPGGGGFGGPPAGPPPACRELMSMRDEVQKHGTAIQKANERRATVQEACKLFKNFLAAESKFIKSLEDSTRSCGVPPDAIKLAKDGHTEASAIGEEVCDAAAQGPRPARPAGSGYDLSPYDVPRRDSWKPGRFRDYDESCELCGTTGDFGWPRDFQPLR
jgi:hypothetical protein